LKREWGTSDGRPTLVIGRQIERYGVLGRWYVVRIAFNEVRKRNQLDNLEGPTIDVVVRETDASKICREKVHFAWRWGL
jgi:hypothetical protein